MLLNKRNDTTKFKNKNKELPFGFRDRPTMKSKIASLKKRGTFDEAER